MRLLIESAFNHSPQAVWAAFESAAFHERLSQESNTTRTVLEERFEGEIRHRRTRVESHKELPGMVAKVLGTKTLTFIQIDAFDPATNCSTWRVEIPSLGDRVSVGGKTTIKATTSGSHRVIDGEVKVRVRLVGGAIEKAVAADFQKTAARAVEIARSLL